MTGCPLDCDDYASFDHHSPHHREGAEERWHRMRELDGLAHSERYGGFFVVTRHADLRKAAAQHGLFTTSEGAALPNESRSRHIPEEVDPPLQREYRRVLDPFLTPNAIAAREPEARALATKLIGALGNERRLDIVPRLTEIFPVHLSLGVFGFPREDAPRLVDLVNRLIRGRGTEDGRTAGAELVRYLEDYIVAKESGAHGAATDVVTAIALGRVQGRPLEMEEKISMTRLLLFGGFTTVNLALSYAIYRIALDPALGDRLHAHPELLPSAAEEFVRLSSPGTYLKRAVTAATELAGVPLDKGDQLLLCFGAANRDPAVFDRPDAVVPDRNPNPHVGFGFGTHRCMGSSLAKLEMCGVIGELLARYARFELDPERAPEWGAGETQGFTSLPLILHQRNS